MRKTSCIVAQHNGKLGCRAPPLARGRYAECQSSCIEPDCAFAEIEPPVCSFTERLRLVYRKRKAAIGKSQPAGLAIRHQSNTRVLSEERYRGEYNTHRFPSCR